MFLEVLWFWDERRCSSFDGAVGGMCLIFRIVHGTGVNFTSGGQPSNIKYRNVEFSRDSLGFSTQLLTLKPRSVYWYRYACMDPLRRLEYEQYLVGFRSDLTDYFYKLFSRDEMAVLLDCRRFSAPHVDLREGIWLGRAHTGVVAVESVSENPSVHWRAPPLRKTSPPLWIRPRHMPAKIRTGNVSDLLHVVMATAALRNDVFASMRKLDCNADGFQELVLNLFFGNSLTDEMLCKAVAAVGKLRVQDVVYTSLRKSATRSLSLLYAGISHYCYRSCKASL